MAKNTPAKNMSQLEKTKIPDRMTEEQVIAIANIIKAYEDGSTLMINWRKGEWWNGGERTKDGLRRRLCDELDWSYETMAKNGEIVAFIKGLNLELSNMSSLIWYHLRLAYEAQNAFNVKPYLELADTNGWSAAEFNREIWVRKLTKRLTAQEADEVSKEVHANPKFFKTYGSVHNKIVEMFPKYFEAPKTEKAKPSTKVTDASSKAASSKAKAARAAKVSNKAPSDFEKRMAAQQAKREAELKRRQELQKAFSIFGLLFDTQNVPAPGMDGFTMTPETFDCIYKMLAKKYHPDKQNGSDAKMTEVNKAKDILQQAGYVSTVLNLNSIL